LGGVELRAQGTVDRSIFPVVVGERGAVSRCSIPFSRQIRSNSTSTGGWWNRPVNTFPLSVRICSGTPQARIAAASPSQTGRVRSRAIRVADTHSREQSSMPVSALAWEPSASRNPPTVSICHSSIGRPRSHRRQLRRRRRRWSGSTSPARTRHRYTADSLGAGDLPRRDSSCAIRRGPHPTCVRRISSTAASTAAGI
jgi:hypothetical protein